MYPHTQQTPHLLQWREDINAVYLVQQGKKKKKKIFGFFLSFSHPGSGSGFSRVSQGSVGLWALRGAGTNGPNRLHAILPVFSACWAL